MKKLPFSARDFADYLVKYEDSCECDAFDFDGISESKHGNLLDAAEKLMNSMAQATCLDKFSSLAEVLVRLDFYTSEYGISKYFWLDVFEYVAENNISHWIVDVLTSTPSITADSIHAGLFDYYVEKDDLYSFLTDVDGGGTNLSTGSSIMMVSTAWCKRKSKLEEKKN